MFLKMERAEWASMLNYGIKADSLSSNCEALAFIKIIAKIYLTVVVI